MKTPTLEEVKKHFDNAKIVKDISYEKEFEINWNNVHLSKFGNWVSDSIDFYYLWSKGKYAEIIEYKEPKFEITKEQILELYESTWMKDELIGWFPKVFESKLEVGEWHKTTTSKSFVFIEKICGDEVFGYGFNCLGEFVNNDMNWIISIEKFKKATTEEVTEALKKEAVRLYAGMYFKSILTDSIVLFDKISHYNFDGHSLWSDGYCIMKDGIWAEIIPSKKMTHQQIEKELGYKIEIV